MFKVFESEDYNTIFNLKTGDFYRWGSTTSEDPQVAPFPEIMDIEISTVCSRGCSMCYKSNTSIGENMSFKTFKTIFDKLPKGLTQIAFGIGDLDANQDLYSILSYTRENNVIPNITVNGDQLSDYHTSNLVKYCGAVAVSYYDLDTCLNAVDKLTQAGLAQCNIHALVSQETEKRCYELLEAYKLDSRLKKLRAIVFLSLKKKGRGTGFHLLPKDRYKFLVEYCLSKKIPIGFDSCSANLVSEFLPDNLQKYVEPCESTCFSLYVNVKGQVFPCSFLDSNFIAPIDLTRINNFNLEVWQSNTLLSFREKLLNNKRNCPCFSITEV